MKKIYRIFFLQYNFIEQLIDNEKTKHEQLIRANTYTVLIESF